MHNGIPSCAAGVPVFRMLPASELIKLGASMDHRHYRRGEIVSASGAPLDHLIVVARGRLNLVHTTVSGREQVVRSLGPGEFLGEMALFYDSVLEGDVVAGEDTSVCVLPRKAVQDVLNHPAALLKLVEELAKRLSAAEQLIADLGLREVGQRLAAELLRLAQAAESGPSGERPNHCEPHCEAHAGEERSGEAHAGEGRFGESHGVRVSVPVPWSQLAVRLGTTPETLSRRLGTLADQGVIRQLGGRTLLILDLGRLKEIAAG